MYWIRYLSFALILSSSLPSALALGSGAGFGFDGWTASNSGTVITYAATAPGLFCSTSLPGGFKQIMITNPTGEQYIGTLVTSNDQGENKYIIDQSISLSSGAALNFGDTLELPFYKAYLLSNESSALIVKRNDNNTAPIRIDLPIKPAQMLLSPDQTKLIILSPEDRALAIVNIAKQEVEKTVEFTDIPQSAVFSSVSPNLLFVTSVDSSTINVLDIGSYSKDTIELPFVPEKIIPGRISSDIFLVDVSGTELITINFWSEFLSECRYNYDKTSGTISIAENETLLDVTTIKDGRLILSVMDALTQDNYLKDAETGEIFTTQLDVTTPENSIYVLPNGQLVVNENEVPDDLAYNVVYLPESQGQLYTTYVNNDLLSGFVLIDSVSGDISIQDVSGESETTQRITTSLDTINQVFVGTPISRSLKISGLNGYESNFQTDSGAEFGFQFENTTQETITIESVNVVNPSEFVTLTDTCSQRALLKDETCSLGLAISRELASEAKIDMDIRLDNGVIVTTHSSVKVNPLYNPQVSRLGFRDESYVEMVFNTGRTVDNTPPSYNGMFPIITTETSTTISEVTFDQEPVQTEPEVTATTEEETKGGSFDFVFLMLALALLSFRRFFRYQY